MSYWVGNNCPFNDLIAGAFTVCPFVACLTSRHVYSPCSLKKFSWTIISIHGNSPCFPICWCMITHVFKYTNMYILVDYSSKYTFSMIIINTYILSDYPSTHIFSMIAFYSHMFSVISNMLTHICWTWNWHWPSSSTGTNFGHSSGTETLTPPKSALEHISVLVPIWGGILIKIGH